MVRPLLFSLAGLAGLAACSIVNAPSDGPPSGGAGGTGGTAGSGAVAGSGGGGEGGGVGGNCGPLNTLQNCGACGHPCAPAHATGATCLSGSCNYGACLGGFSDCDADRTNGCEAELAADPANCGSCDHACADQGFQNVEDYTCATSTCDYTVCAASFGDCDNNRGNGCERATNTLTDCGGCNVPCSPQNAVSPTCATGTCDYAGCVSDYQSCDNNPANGCESNRLTDHDNCGSCNHPCADAEGCLSGSCTSVNPQCLQAYNTFTAAERNVANVNGTVYCDLTGNGSPEWVGPGWYRFTSAAGTTMPEYVPAEYSCGTHAPGWLNGAHPAPQDGVVARTVCFNWGGNSCAWTSAVQIVNCSGFYLYYLPDTSACNLRYCGN